MDEARPGGPRVDPAEVAITAIRAEGPGGQNVHKVCSAVHLRFDIRASSLPDAIQQRLLARSDARLSNEGVLVIKAQDHRSLARNRDDAMARLQALVDEAAAPPRRRIATRPTRGSQRRKAEAKRQRSAVKAGRAPVRGD